MSLLQDDLSLDDLNELDAEELLRWACAAYGERVAIITSFQNTGCVMVDMAWRAGLAMRVATVDTLRLHPETYAYIEALEGRYGLRVERFAPDSAELDRMVRQHGEFLFFDGKPKQELCCSVRKVAPHRRILATVDAWVTGLRRDQSGFRAGVPKAALTKEGEREVLKLSPLADWTEERVRAYLAGHGVPLNPLYGQGYTSIGCMICTTPTLPWEEKRAGRWRWFNGLEYNTKECGIHVDGSGI